MKIEPEDIVKLFEDSKKRQSAFNCFKSAAVIVGNYELAANLRSFERDTFYTDEMEQEKSRARIYQSYFSNIGVSLSLLDSWILGKNLEGIKPDQDKLIKATDFLKTIN